MRWKTLYTKLHWNSSCGLWAKFLKASWMMKSLVWLFLHFPTYLHWFLKWNRNRNKEFGDIGIPEGFVNKTLGMIPKVFSPHLWWVILWLDVRDWSHSLHSSSTLKYSIYILENETSMHGMNEGRLCKLCWCNFTSIDWVPIKQLLEGFWIWNTARRLDLTCAL